MVRYICKTCGLDFKQKSHYDNHKARKKPCKPIQDKLEDIQKSKPQFTDLSKSLTKELDKKTKKDNGIFFTPLNIVKETFNEVFEYCSSNNIIINSILEPSCGSCEFIKYIDSSLKDKIIDGIEYNTTIYDKIKDIDFKNSNNVTIVNGDYLKTDEKKYDLIIGNPPYFVMSKKDVDKKFHNYFDGRPNIFVIFILHSLLKLNEGGILSFVLPKSFCNCTYYNKLRLHLYTNYYIINITDCSNEKYLETAQDTIILTVQNKKGDNGQFSLIKNDIILLNTPENIEKINILYNETTTINDMELFVKVGNTVWNQVKDLLTNDDKQTRLIYSSDIKNNELTVSNFKDESKKNYINKKGENGPLLIVNRGYGVGKYSFNYCLVNIEKEYTIENHLITIRPSKGTSYDELLEKYHKIIKSFNNKKTQDFIKLYCSNSALNTNELQNILPIYL